MHRVQREFHDIITGGFHVSFAWVSSHVARKRTSVSFAFIERPHLSQSHIEICSQNYQHELWTGQWRDVNRDLFELKPTTRKWAKIYKLSRREEVLINNLRLAHTRVTDVSLVCSRVLSIKHAGVKESYLALGTYSWNAEF